MSTTKRTYSLVRETVDDLEAAVPEGQRSAVVSEAIRGWLDARYREALRAQVIEGCHEMAEIYRTIEHEYHPLEEEVQRGLEEGPRAGSSRSRKAGSRPRVRTGR